MKTKSKGHSGRRRAALPGTTEKVKTEAIKTTKAKSSRKRTRQHNKKLGHTVKEAKRDLVVPLLEFDVEKAAEAKPDDVNSQDNFLSCVIAQAVTRACGAERVWIGRKTAYVAFPGENLTRRYEVSSHSRHILEAWDKGEEIEEGVELVLRAPSKKRTRAAMRETWKKNKQWHRKSTTRKQRGSDPLHNIVRNGNLVRWS